MSSGILLNKEKSLILDKTDIENNKSQNINTNPIPNNNLNQYNDNSNLINSNNNIDNNNKMAYSLTESALNQRQINIPKGEMTDFNRNFNGEIKLDKSKQEKTVVCWHCNSLLVVKEGWEIEDRLDKLLALIKNSEKEKSKRKGEEVKVLGEGIGGKEKKIKVKEPKKRIKKMFFKSDEIQRTPFEAIKSSNKFGRKTNYSYIRSIMIKKI